MKSKKTKKKDILGKDTGKYISFAELTEAREQEMEGVLPGFQTRIEMGDKDAVVTSPGTFERSLFKVGNH
jgi:hypothetical protein